MPSQVTKEKDSAPRGHMRTLTLPCPNWDLSLLYFALPFRSHWNSHQKIVQVCQIHIQMQDMLMIKDKNGACNFCTERGNLIQDVFVWGTFLDDLTTLETCEAYGVPSVSIHLSGKEHMRITCRPRNYSMKLTNLFNFVSLLYGNFRQLTKRWFCL